jgi:peptide-methionine (S)-S-oxide reductase
MINRREKIKMETVYIAGGCLWGVQHFFDTVPGVQMTEAGRANGTTSSLDGPYDGYAECVKVVYDEKNTSISELMAHLFEIIDPYSLNKQGVDVGKKYRTGLYSTDPRHLEEARAFINGREDRDKIMLEVLIYVPRVDGQYARSLNRYTITAWDKDGNKTYLTSDKGNVGSGPYVKNNPSETKYAILPLQ